MAAKQKCPVSKCPEMIPPHLSVCTRCWREIPKGLKEILIERREQGAESYKKHLATAIEVIERRQGNASRNSH